MLRKLFDRRRFLCLAASCLTTGWWAPPYLAAAEDPPAPTAQQLVDQLAADSYLVREHAQRELLKLGEKAQKELEQAVQSQDVEQRMRAEYILRELRREALWEPSRVTFSQRQIPVLEAFREIADQTGNPVNWDLTPKSLNRLVDVGWEEETYWHAMDELSKQCDVIPRFYDDPKRAGVVLTHGYLSAGPSDYIGPLRASLLYARHHVSETLNFGDGVPDRQESLELTMALHWEQQFPLCRYGQPVILEAVTEHGEELAIAKKSQNSLMHVSRRQRQLVFSFRITPPQTRPATTLSSLRAGLSLAAAGDFICLELPSLAPGAHSQQLGYSLELLEWEAQEKATVLTLLWTRPHRFDKMNATDMADEYLEILNDQGIPMPFHQQKVQGNSVQVQFTIHVPVKSGKPSGVRYHVATLRSEKTVEFRFEDVPLPNTIR